MKGPASFSSYNIYTITEMVLSEVNLIITPLIIVGFQYNTAMAMAP